MRRPPFHPHAQAVMDAVSLPSITVDLIDCLRVQNAGDPHSIAEHGLQRTDHDVPGYRGEGIEVTTWRKPYTRHDAPLFVFLHGGGQISGDRWSCGDIIPDVLEHRGVLACIEYRLAPEHQAPTQVEDCYAALCWLVEHAEEIGFDPARIILGGTSAGGGLAAGTLLLCRDRGGPRVLAGWLNTPMLDDTTSSTSAQQYVEAGHFWTGRSNVTAWQAVLGERYGTDEVTCHEAPARAQDLSGLPPLLVTVGAAEPFRDEAVAFASRVWRDGGDCQLLVVAGGIHCFADALPDSWTALSQQATVRTWITAQLSPDPDEDAARAIERLKPDEENFRR